MPERSERALAAGCDVVLNCWAKMDDMTGIAERCRSLSEAAHGRLARVQAAMGEPLDGPPSEELLVKRDALLALAGGRA